MIPLRRRSVLVLCGLALLVSCSNSAPPSFLWKDGAGKTLQFSEVLSRGREGGALLGPSLPERIWLLASARQTGPGTSLALRLQAGPLAGSGGPVEVEVALSSSRDGSSPFLREVHRMVGPRDTFILPPVQGRSLRTIRVSLLSGQKARTDPVQGKATSRVGDGAWSVQVLAIEETPVWAGFQVGPDGLRISAGVSVFLKDGEEHVLIPTSPDPGDAGPGPSPGLLVSYGPGGQGRSLQILAEGGQTFAVKLRPSGLSTVIPPALCRAGGGRLELVLPRGVEARAFALGILPEEENELADFGRILRAPAPEPGKDYELYRWDLLPSVLIFDFRDYAVQDSYLRRLAFFVEKAGHKGKLMTDAELGSLHSWNAHDYRPEDIAAFYEAARAGGFPLGKAEIGLRSLLLGRGMIKVSGQSYVAGEGALISIARESPPYLRTMFLTHESTHGIFFVDAAYRDYVRGLWASMDREEKWYWNLFLGWKEYDTSNPYLMANEYQAYLLQQVLPQVPDYFIKLQPGRILENHKELQPRMDAWMVTWKDSFAARAAALDAWMSAKYGFQAGRGASY